MGAGEKDHRIIQQIVCNQCIELFRNTAKEIKTYVLIYELIHSGTFQSPKENQNFGHPVNTM